MVEIRLKEWEELCGTLKSLEKDDFSVSIHIGDCHLVFNSESSEGKTINEKLDGVMIGSRLSILKTDIIEKPIIIKVDKLEQDPTPLLRASGLLRK